MIDVNVNVTLIGETVVLRTEADLPVAREALDAAAKREGRYVWIVNECAVDVLRGYELGMKETEELAGGEYSSGEDYERVLQADYVRYNDSIYPLTDFSTTWGIGRDAGLPTWMEGWHSYVSDSFFSGLVLRYNKDDEGDRESDFTGESGVTIARYITG